jgi:replicative DNA helicase
LREAEQAVIGCMLMAPDTTSFVFSRIDQRMFEEPALATIYHCCYKLHKAGIPYDAVTVLGKLGDEYKILIAECAQTAPSISRLEHYAAAVMEDWRKRTLANQLAEIQLGDLDSDEALRRLHDITAEQSRIQAYIGDTYTKDFARSAAEFCAELATPDTSIKTGWEGFDRVVGGLQRKSVYVVAARPGKGKTDWALQMACSVAQKASVLYCTMEMPATQLMQRIVSRCTKINSIRLRDKMLTEEELGTVGSIINELSRLTRLSFDEEPALTTASLEEKIQRYSPDVVIIDHIGLMDKGSNRNPWDAVAENCHRLKSLALAKDIAVVELVQLNRRTDKEKATQGDMYGGSAVEQDADAVFALAVEAIEKVLDGVDSVGVTVSVLKNRHGGTGDLRFRWMPQYHLYLPEEGEN